MSGAVIRKVGRAGRITLSRPQALNALTADMSTAIEAALDEWRDDADVAVVVIDADGDRAFCAGGDIVAIYRHGIAGDHDFARDFWRQEYRMNLKIARYPKPVVALVHGITMGGGVGVGCHARHRVACESTVIAMPECGIGMVPDVGGTWLLGRAPGRLGAYLGLTSARMGPADAIYAGFADAFVPRQDWPALIASLEQSGDPRIIAEAQANPGPSSMRDAAPVIDRHFARPSLAAIMDSLARDSSDLAGTALGAMRRNAPLAMACALDLYRGAGTLADVGTAFMREYRFAYRAQSQGDLLEGIRAQVIDKDRTPRWRHASAADVTEAETAAMLAPLGAQELDPEDAS